MTEDERILHCLNDDQSVYDKLSQLEKFFKYNHEYWERKQRRLLSVFKNLGIITGCSESPEDIYLRKEQNEELIAALEKSCTEEELYMYWLYTIENFSQEEIAKLLGTYQRNISRKLKKIQEKCLKNPNIPPYIERVYSTTKESKKSLAAPVSKYAKTFLFEFYQPNIKLKKKCSMKQYLEESFNDNKCLCSLCLDEFGQKHCIN